MTSVQNQKNISSNMNILLCLAALVAVCLAQETKHTPPKVQMYSYKAGEFGKANTLICHVSNFHPPDITIQLMKDGVEIPGAVQTDLAFKQDWRFHLTKNVAFTPKNDEKYICKVTHGTNVHNYAWEPNM